jgi:hypothetical protein
MGSHHFVFRDYCEHCAPKPEPLRSILQYDACFEWLECGHKLHTRRDFFGRIRPGKRRRCYKCKSHAPKEFDALEMLRLQRKEAFSKKLRHQRDCTIRLPYRTTEKNWYKYIYDIGLNYDNCNFYELEWYMTDKTNRAAKVREALAQKAAFELGQEQKEWAYNSDDH